MRPPFGELPAGAGGDGILAPGCPVRALGRAAFGRMEAFVYEADGTGLWLLSRSAHTHLAILDLFGTRQNWLSRLWPRHKGSLRGFDVKAAAPVDGLTAVARQYRRDRRGEIASGCPIVSLGFARMRGGGELSVRVYDHAAIYAVAGPAEGLYAIRSGAHGCNAIMGLFARHGHAAWREQLWPLLQGQWHRWDGERAAGVLLEACSRRSSVEPAPLPDAEIVPFRKPSPPAGRLWVPSWNKDYFQC